MSFAPLPIASIEPIRFNAIAPQGAPRFVDGGLPAVSRAEMPASSPSDARAFHAAMERAGSPAAQASPVFPSDELAPSAPLQPMPAPSLGTSLREAGERLSADHRRLNGTELQRMMDLDLSKADSGLEWDEYGLAMSQQSFKLSIAAGMVKKTVQGIETLTTKSQ